MHMSQPMHDTITLPQISVKDEEKGTSFAIGQIDLCLIPTLITRNFWNVVHREIIGLEYIFDIFKLVNSSNGWKVMTSEILYYVWGHVFSPTPNLYNSDQNCIFVYLLKIRNNLRYWIYKDFNTQGSKIKMAYNNKTWGHDWISKESNEKFS